MRERSDSATGKLFSRDDLTERRQVFADRGDAGRVLAEMLEPHRAKATVAAIPAGGVPVGAPIAQALGLRLCPVVVSKITPPWNSEVGYGAVAFDGSVRLDEPMVERLGIDRATVERGIAETRAKVERRVAVMGQPEIEAGAAVIVVDDGLASGFTLHVAVEALRGLPVGDIIVAIPTGSTRAARSLAREVDELYCANLRSGHSFAVADAYERWRDVPDEEAIEVLKGQAVTVSG